MSTPILLTKLYKPTPRPHLVSRARLIDSLNQSRHHKLTLISAAAGFGKTTLVSFWAEISEVPVAWLALDEDDADVARFLTYLITALQTFQATLGQKLLKILQSPPIPPVETLLISILNEVMELPENCVLVLDDYHLVDSPVIDNVLSFLVKHLPPQLHLLIITREDPNIQLSRLRARGEMLELRARDLRFTVKEATEFFNQNMGLNLKVQDIANLAERTEGWIAGLQLAAISLQNHPNPNQIIEEFTGSHYFVMDYLLEEVLNQQPAHIQDFLLKTAILNRMCASLGAALLEISEEEVQNILETLEQANLFVVPLDNARDWYRYHHLFGGLLRQRASKAVTIDIVALHLRASTWYEEHNFAIEAFHHASQTQDMDRIIYLVQGDKSPLYFQGTVSPILKWLQSLAPTVLNAQPELWVTFATVLSIAGRNHEVESKLDAAEEALKTHPDYPETSNLIGEIATLRALLAAPQFLVDTILEQANLALANLHPANTPMRTLALWSLAIASQFQGERLTARQAYAEVIALCQQTDNFFINILAHTGLGILYELDNELQYAAEIFELVVAEIGEPPLPMACEAYLGLARLAYQWNDLTTAQEYAQKSVELARQIDGISDYVGGELLLGRLKFVTGDRGGASAHIMQVEQEVHHKQFTHFYGNVATEQIRILIHQQQFEKAKQFAETYELPLSQARVSLAENNPAETLEILNAYLQTMFAQKWADEILRTQILQALAYFQQDELAPALEILGEVLHTAEPHGFVRLFLDEGPRMQDLLQIASQQQLSSNYVTQLLTAFVEPTAHPAHPSDQPLVEPLSERELEVLQLVADGLSNREISERLFIALDTVKGHNRRIYGKLQVQRRTEAVARARELGLI